MDRFVFGMTRNALLALVAAVGLSSMAHAGRGHGKKGGGCAQPAHTTCNTGCGFNDGCNTVRPIYGSTCNTGCGNVYTGGYAAGGCATAVAVTQLSRPVALATVDMSQCQAVAVAR